MSYRVRPVDIQIVGGMISPDRVAMLTVALNARRLTASCICLQIIAPASRRRYEWRRRASRDANSPGHRRRVAPPLEGLQLVAVAPPRLEYDVPRQTPRPRDPLRLS